MSKRKCLENFLCSNLDGVYRFAYTYMRNREDAEDIVNDSVVKALANISKLKNEEAVRCWFYSIVANTALSALRKRGRLVCSPADELVLPSSEDDHSMLNFESMINTLGEEIKAIVVMKCCDDMTFAEISKVLGINENTVKTRFYKAVKGLKNESLI